MAYQQWEYIVIDTDITPKLPDVHPYTELNKEGAKGWELVAAVPRNASDPNSNRYVFFYKRPKSA